MPHGFFTQVQFTKAYYDDPDPSSDDDKEHTIINYTFESVWSSRHSFRYSAMAESDSSAGRYVADRTETATATSLAVTSEYALSKTRSSVVWSLAVQAPPNLEPCVLSA